MKTSWVIGSRPLMANTRARRLSIAFGVYAVVVGTFFAVAPRFRILEHTPFNHFSLLAETWLHHRLDLGGSPPGYAQNNDFAAYHGKWFVTFPPFPAVLLVPFLLWGKTAENVRDAQVFLWFSGIGPAALFLALEKLRRMGVSERTVATNAVLALLFAFGTVYFFTAVQGTVWFAAHVVGVGIAALYLLFALDAERPVLAGLMIGFGFLTRTPLLFAVPLFVFEAVRVSLRAGTSDEVPTTWFARAVAAFVVWTSSRRRQAWDLARSRCRSLCVGGDAVAQQGAFRSPTRVRLPVPDRRLARPHEEVGALQLPLPRAEPGRRAHGLALVRRERAHAHGQMNEHGLALWVTTPLYLWLIWPKRCGPVVTALYVTAAAVAIPGLFYQNTGWMQFGFRFSNDYSIFLFALLAVTGRRRFGALQAAAAWSIAINAFGAATFDRGEFKKFYYEDPSQKVLYQPERSK